MHRWRAREIHKYYDEMNKNADEDDAEGEVRESFDRVVRRSLTWGFSPPSEYGRSIFPLPRLNPMPVNEVLKRKHISQS